MVPYDQPGMAIPTGVPTYPFQPLIDRWFKVFEAAKKDKQEKFDQWADEAMQFFDGPLNWMWKDAVERNKGETGHNGFLAESEGHMPRFQMSVNRLFEAVALFGPSLYHQNPTIAVTPRMRPTVGMDTFYATDQMAGQYLALAQNPVMSADPAIAGMIQQYVEQYNQVAQNETRSQQINQDHAKIIEFYANYLQNEGNKQAEARLAITEALVTGLGLLETVVDYPPGGGPKMPMSRYRCHKDLLIDPDACYWRDVTWIALRSVAPCNQVEKKFGLPLGSLKAQYSKKSSQAGQNQRSKQRDGNNKVVGKSHELIEYWEVYSKNGAGQNLKIGEKDKKPSEMFDQLGDYVYLAICKDHPFPFNVPPNMSGMMSMPGGLEPVMESTAWEAPYWDDHKADGGWPITRLCFYSKPGEVWPISPAKPCIAELRFVNWCMSFLADGVAAGSRTYVAMQKGAAENIKQQLVGGNGPFTLIELERISGMNINELVSFLQAPTFNSDIWNMVAQVNEQIDKRLGLTELLYGMSGRQIRSAAEASYRQGNVNIRPDDMASRVEDWLSLSATREIQALRWACDYEDVLPVLGEVGAHVFQTQILTQDVSSITRDFMYRVEAGTARKPNKDTKIAQLTDLSQYLLPAIMPLVNSGVYRPLNAFLEDLGNAMDFDPKPYLLGEEDRQVMIQNQMMQMMPPPADPQNSDNEEGDATEPAEN